VRALRSRRTGERILGLAGAARVRPPEALDALVRLARRDPVLADAATGILAGYPGVAGTRGLLAALRSREASARAVAADGLSWREAPAGGAVERALVGALRRDRSWTVRAEAGRALGLASRGRFSARAELALLGAMDNPREPFPVRSECAAALARGEVSSGWRHLGAEVHAPEVARAVLAVMLAAEAGGERGAAILVDALRDDRPAVWTAAARFFVLAGRAPALVALSELVERGGRLGRRAALALAPVEGRRVLPELLAGLESDSAVMRGACCEALARALGPEAAAALERRLLDPRETVSVRVAAAGALGRVGGPAVAASLRRASENDADGGVRASARDALMMVEARLRKGPEAVSEPAAERMAFSRWALLGLVPGSPAGCRLRDGRGREGVYRIGDQVAFGYRLVHVLGAGESAGAAEMVLAGPAAAREDLLRVIVAKGDRSVVLVAEAVKAGG
jgi:hypothetical protein